MKFQEAYVGQAPKLEIKSLEKQFKATHDVPLTHLLSPENQDNPISEDRVSVYSFARPQGTEHVVVFPALDGNELYSRLRKISKYSPGIDDVTFDIGYILGNNQYLRDKHEEGLGILWETFYNSLPHQKKVFSHGADYRPKPQVNLNAAKETLKALDMLSEAPPEPYFGVQKEIRNIKDMLEGRSQVDVAHLTNFFMLKINDVRKRNGVRVISRKKASMLIRGKGSKTQVKSIEPLVIEASKEKAMKTNESGKIVYDEEKLVKLAERTVQEPQKFIRLKIDGQYFIAPRAKYELLINGPYSDLVKLIINTEGKVTAGEQVRTRLQDAIEIAEINQLKYGVLAVPIVRIIETNGSTRGFIFHETESAPPLPAPVVKEIKKRVDSSRMSRFPCEDDWISGMVGVDMLLVAHPKARSIVDVWSTIWNRERITFSQVMGIEPPYDAKTRERTQFNGPVQAGIVALAAFVRYPEQFDTFIDKVKKLQTA